MGQADATTVSRRAAALLGVGFDGKTLTPQLMRLIDAGVSGVVLFSRNVESPEQVARLIYDIKSYAKRAIYVAVDQEGGVVQRLRVGFTRLPSMRAVGASGDPVLARRLGELMGTELRAVGVDVDFAPVIDVDTNPENPVIGDRSFSRDPALVARLGVALAEGLQAQGVAACGKHFPGHGDTELDSHLHLPAVHHEPGRLDQVELVPFSAFCRAKLAAVMTAHVVFSSWDPTCPATMSPAVITGVLRERLNYDGFVISDDLEMKAIADHFGAAEAAIWGLLAGVDHFLVCHRAEVVDEVTEGLAQAVLSGRVPEDRLRTAERRHAKFLRDWAKPPTVFDPTALASAQAQEFIRAILAQAESSEAAGVDPTEREKPA